MSSENLSIAEVKNTRFWLVYNISQKPIFAITDGNRCNTSFEKNKIKIPQKYGCWI
jgi:hypothetical protein